jgi:hypothetical protein
VERGLAENPAPQPVIRAAERVAGVLADRVHAAGAEPSTEHLRPASSLAARREIRLRAVNVTTVARSRGPNAEPAIPPDKRVGFMN